MDIIDLLRQQILDNEEIRENNKVELIGTPEGGNTIATIYNKTGTDVLCRVQLYKTGVNVTPPPPPICYQNPNYRNILTPEILNQGFRQRCCESQLKLTLVYDPNTETIAKYYNDDEDPVQEEPLVPTLRSATKTGSPDEEKKTGSPRGGEGGEASET